MNRAEEIENSIITKYKNSIYKKFRKAVDDYNLINDKDKICVCISGGKDSMLLAKCLEEYQKHGEKKFELVYVSMDPGYEEKNKQKIRENAKILGIDLKIVEKDVFEVVEKQTWGSPCFLCAKMRRGCLYGIAESFGCNKIALGHHMDDALETLLLNIFYAGEIKTMLPKIHSDNYNIELIRPLYLVKEDDIISWRDYNNLEFLDCACKVTKEIKEKGEQVSKRKAMKNLIKKFRAESEYIDKSIFHSMSNVNLDSIIGWKKDGKKYSFLDEYDLKGKKDNTKNN